jgi:GNAT superfamily N-acetyltransferase
MDGGRIVGASSGLPLADDAEAFRAPFEAAGIDIARVFYFGESVLLPEYRGRGLGHAFFDAREAHAAALGRFDWTAFCAVDRDTSDPRRTPDYRGNEALWGKRGYVRRDDLRCTLGWPEAEGGLDVAHTLTFRLRPISRAS